MSQNSNIQGKLKVKHRLINLNYQQTYSLDMIWWLIRCDDVGFTLDPIDPEVYTDDTYVHRQKRHITITHKDITVKAKAPFGIDTEIIGNLFHELNHIYYDKHLEDPEKYPLDKWHNKKD